MQVVQSEHNSVKQFWAGHSMEKQRPSWSLMSSHSIPDVLSPQSLMHYPQCPSLNLECPAPQFFIPIMTTPFDPFPLNLDTLPLNPQCSVLQSPMLFLSIPDDHLNVFPHQIMTQGSRTPNTAYYMYVLYAQYMYMYMYMYCIYPPMYTCSCHIHVCGAKIDGQKLHVQARTQY